MHNEFGSIWTHIKLEVVTKYMDAYFEALKKQPFKYCYIDAFAGSGVVETRQGPTVGSALRALDYNFTRYIYFEKKQAFYDELIKNVKQHPDYMSKKDKITIQLGDCNSYISDMVKEFDSDWMWRGVAFLDPYAMHLDWPSLESIVRTKKFDVWYLIPYSAILRSLENETSKTADDFKAVTRVFGTKDWYEELYHEPAQKLLFPSEDDEGKRNRVKEGQVREYIKKRLRTIFGDGLLSDPLELKQSTNSTIFLLFFGCSNDSPAAISVSHRIARYLIDAASKN